MPGWLCQVPRMRFLAVLRARLPDWRLAALPALVLLDNSLATAALDVALTTNAAPAGFVEVSGVEAGPFNPLFWQAGTLNLVPDLRSPLLAFSTFGLIHKNLWN